MIKDMDITLFTMAMSALSSSILIALFYCFRKKLLFHDLVSLRGMVMLYIIVMLRFVFPVEMPWAVGVRFPLIWNRLYETIHMNQKYILLVWIGAAGCLLMRLVVQYIRAARGLRSVQLLNVQEWSDILCEKQYLKFSARKIRVGTLEGLQTPVSIGIIHPQIILPPGAYTSEEYDNILRHELTHIKHHDLTVKLLVKLLCCVIWWNPFVWLLQKDLEQVQELRCDQTVLRDADKAKTISYMKTIVKVMSDMQKVTEMHPLLQSDALCLLHFEQAGVKERFLRIQKERSRKRNPAFNNFSVVLSALILFLSYTFVLQPAYDPSAGDVSETNEYIMIDEKTDYIVDGGEGVFFIVNKDGDVLDIITKDEAKALINVGFKYKGEEK